MGKEEVTTYIKRAKVRRQLPQDLLKSLCECDTKAEAKRRMKIFLRENHLPRGD